MTRASQFKVIYWAIALGLLWPRYAPAVGPTVEIISQSEKITDPGRTGTGRLLPAFLHGTVGISTGYDDDLGASGGLDATLFYSRKFGRTQINLLTGAGVVYYLGGDRSSDRNALVQMSIVYPVSLRLTLDGNISARYQVEPDFASDAGLNRRAGNFINLDSLFAARYRWSLRLSSSSTYGFRLINYDNPASGALSDRIEQTFGQELSYRWSLRTTLIGDYRLTKTDYDLAPRDSTTQFLLGGFAYQFSRRTNATVRGGVSLRSENRSSRVDPNFQGSLQYSLGARGSLFWNAGFSIEEANAELASTRTTVRTGLGLNYLLTWRLSADLGLNYHHDENDGATFSAIPGATASSFSEDAFELSLGLRYVLNRRFTLQLSVIHSEVISTESLREYARNRYSLGLNFAF